MTGAPPRNAGGYGRFLAWVVGLTVALGLVGALPTRHLAGGGAIPALLAGCAIGAVASALGGVPVALARRGPKDRMAQAALAAMGLRFVVAVGLTVAAALSGLFARGPLLVWVAISYVVLLAADTRYALGAMRAERSTETVERVEKSEKRESR